MFSFPIYLPPLSLHLNSLYLSAIFLLLFLIPYFPILYIIITLAVPITKLRRRPSHSGHWARPFSMAVSNSPTDIGSLVPILEDQTSPPSPSPPPTRFNCVLKLDECMLAVLEDPDPQEVTTPGVYIEVSENVYYNI